MTDDRYLVFGGHTGRSGGAEDFIEVFNTLADAKTTAMNYGIVHNPRLSTWVHIARLRGKDFVVIARLNIPGTEYDDTGVLEWLEDE